MRKGCVVFTVLLALAIGVAGYFAYSYLSQSLDIPDEYAEYEHHDDALAHITSKAPAPGPEERLTEERMRILLVAFDSIQAGWRVTEVAIDSLTHAGKAADSNQMEGILTMPRFVRQAMLGLLITRKGLVTHLNAHNLSWAEYQWLKTRAIAAAGINRAEADSNFVLSLPSSLAVRTQDHALDDEANEALFRNVEQVRGSGAIDSSEITLAQHHRAALLSRGAAALKGMEEAKTGLHMGARIRSSGE